MVSQHRSAPAAPVDEHPDPPTRITPDGRVAVRILQGPRPWVAIAGGGWGAYLEVETYTDEAARHWRRFAVEPDEVARRKGRPRDGRSR